MIVALRRIEPDEEITYDYGRDYLKSFLADGGCCCADCRRKKALWGRKRTRVSKLANADEVNRMRRLMSAYGHKADMLLAFRHVRFWG